MKKINIGSGRTAMHYTFEKYSNDISVHIDGGCSHIGSVSMAEGDFLKTVSFETHKEHFLTEPLAKALADKFGCRVVVTAGVHLDNITREEISIIVKQNEDFISRIEELLQEQN